MLARMTTVGAFDDGVAAMVFTMTMMIMMMTVMMSMKVLMVIEAAGMSCHSSSGPIRTLTNSGARKIEWFIASRLLQGMGESLEPAACRCLRFWFLGISVITE